METESMGWPFGKRRVSKQLHEHQLETGSSVEVIELRNVHKKADETKKDIDKLNRLLKANGITLRIHIATHKGKVINAR